MNQDHLCYADRREPGNVQEGWRVVVDTESGRLVVPVSARTAAEALSIAATLPRVIGTCYALPPGF